MDETESMNEKESIISEAKPETRLQKAMGGALRWGLVVFLALGLGALIITFVLYLPTRNKLDDVNADLEQAKSTITSQTEQIATLQSSNETLQKDLDSTKLHMHMLTALSGMRAASLAVATGDYARARLSLIQAS